MYFPNLNDMPIDEVAKLRRELKYEEHKMQVEHYKNLEKQFEVSCRYLELAMQRKNLADKAGKL